MKELTSLKGGVLAALAAMPARIRRFCAMRGRSRLAAMRSNDSLLRSLHAHSKVSITDRAGRITEVNDNFCRIMGYTRGELLGATYGSVNSGVHGSDFWAGLWRTIVAGSAWRGEICNRAKDGSLHWVDCIIAPITGTTGAVDQYISIGTEVTAAKLTEQRLRSSEAFLDRTSRTAGIGGWQFNLITGVVEWSTHMNRIYETDLGYQPTLEESLSFYPAEFRAAIEAAVLRARRAGAGWDLELPLVTAKGRAIWVRNVGTVECEGGVPVRMVGSMQDITERKHVERSLHHERDLMASLLETLPDQIYFKDGAGRYLRVNAGMARRHGLKDPAEAIGKSDADFFPQAHVLSTAAIERQVMASGEPVVEMEERTLWPDRPPTWSLSTKMPLYDAEDRIVGTVGVSRDITARKGVEAQLQEAGARFAIAADSAGIGVWEFEPAGERLDWDERMHQIYGITGEAGLRPYSLWVDRLHPEDRVRCLREIDAALRGEKEFDSEFRIVRPDGEIRYLRAAARTLRAADGTTLRMIGVNFDTTERRLAELALLETSSVLRTVLDSALETSFIATDPNLVIKVFNAGAARLLGYLGEEVIDRSTLQGMHDPEELTARAEELGARLGRTLDAGAVLTEPSTLGHPRNWRYVRRDGTHVRVSLVVSGMYAPTGELLGYLGVAHDVSRQQQYEDSLHEAMRKADAANRAKSQFLANMSHEIRTPMNAVIGLSYLLAQTRLEPEQRDFLAKIQGSSQLLLAVINDVLDLTKIESAELLVENAAFSPYGVLRGVSDVVDLQARAKGVIFEVDLPDDLPLALRGDATRLSQILTNLLANAVKFTDQGSVILRVTQLNDTPGATTLRFAVSDTGIGISAAAQMHLFEPFSQADASITRRYGGTGLGLSIVKSLAKLLGGEVSMESTPGVGSVFTVVLKFAAAAVDTLSVREAYPSAPAERVLRGIRVFLVDDSDINLDVTQRILELHGADVEVARNGIEACDRLRERPQDFDVALMDVQMPLLDGYQATRRIREDLGLVDLPIIALTAGALSSDRQEAADAGMDDFLVKPFDAAALITSILRHVRHSSLSAATPNEELSLPPAPRTVPWPSIEGINTTDTRVRLCDDFGLFQSSLSRLLDEFAEVAAPLATQPPADWALYAARMHKLTGSAGMLGANAIQHLALDTRAASVTGDVKLAERLSVALADQLRLLRDSAAPVLDAARIELEKADAAACAAADMLHPRVLAEFVQALRRQDLSALYRFDSLAHRLRPVLGKEHFDLVRTHVENLRFIEAADVLEQGQAALDPPLPPTGS